MCLKRKTSSKSIKEVKFNLSINKSDKNKFNSKSISYNNTKTRQIIVQCPDCGELFSLNGKLGCFCKGCERLFTESEIRERCGL